MWSRIATMMKAIIEAMIVVTLENKGEIMTGVAMIVEIDVTTTDVSLLSARPVA